MCSCRTYVPVIACIVIPGFDLRAALRLRPGLALAPAALAPLPGTEPLLGPGHGGGGGAGRAAGDAAGGGARDLPAARARRAGPGRRSSRSGRRVLRRLEDAGFAVEPVEPGTVYFETRGVERLYGGLEPALKRALAAVGAVWDAARGRGRAALRGARGGERRAAGAGADRLRRSHARFLSPLPLTLLPLERSRCEELRGARGRDDWTACRAAGRRRCRTLGAGRPARLEPGERRSRTGGSRPAPGGGARRDAGVPGSGRQELTLRRGLSVLVDRLLARPERAGRPPRKLALWARLAGGASWRRTRDAARADRGARPAARGARPEARGAAGAGARSCGSSSWSWRRGGRAARARPRRGREWCKAGSRRVCARCGRASARAGSRRSWRWRRGRGSRRRAHCSYRATTERRRGRSLRALVEAHATARRGRVNRQGVALVREEWRVVDRWWTEEPVDRRYFDVVLETGRERRRLPGRGDGCVVHAARVIATRGRTSRIRRGAGFSPASMRRMYSSKRMPGVCRLRKRTRSSLAFLNE